MKNKKLIQRLTATALIAGMSAFLLTGVAQSTAYGMPGIIPTTTELIKHAGDFSAYLTAFSPDYFKAYSDISEEISTPEAEFQETTSQPDTSSTPPQTEENSFVTSAPENESTIEVNKVVLGSSLLISENISDEKSSTGQYTSRDGKTENRFFGRISGDNAVDLPGGGQLNNFTEMPEAIILQEGTRAPDIRIEKNSLPQVLIMHTHTTESYEPFDDGRYDSRFNGRSLSPADSVVGMGAIISQKLADNGICTVHDGTIHDDPLYSYSYSRSRERVKEILEQYPSIKVVLDIHRDGIESDGVRIAPVTEIDGKEAAQVMIICGSDDGTGILPDYMSNLRFATYLQGSIEAQYPTLTRPLLFDYRYYNQDLTTGSLLIELGALGNTKEQAKYTAELLGNALANALSGLSEG